MAEDFIKMALALVGAYLIGSVPTAYIVGRLTRGIDIRKVGTRNMGAMNTIYTLGLAWGILVLAIDIGKGVAAILLAGWLGVPLYIQLAAGGIVVAGHIFPVFLRFRGGKGGAVCIGVFATLMPWAIPFGAGIFLLLLLATRFPTLSYSLALCCAPFVAWLKYHSGALALFSVIMLLLLLARYIPRLKEMYSTAGGSWRRVFLRRNIKDRF
jgi:glycerol-3-phosphate acyltransferase PlsY